MTNHQIIYSRHKENGECTRCGTKLNEDEKAISLQCLSCRAKAQIKRESPAHKLKTKQYSDQRYKSNPQYQIKKVADRQDSKRKLGICVTCAQPAWNGHVRCKKHVFMYAEYAKNKRLRKKQLNQKVIDESI